MKDAEWFTMSGILRNPRNFNLSFLAVDISISWKFGNITLDHWFSNFLKQPTFTIKVHLGNRRCKRYKRKLWLKETDLGDRILSPTLQRNCWVTWGLSLKCLCLGFLTCKLQLMMLYWPPPPSFYGRQLRWRSEELCNLGTPCRGLSARQIKDVHTTDTLL